MMPTACSTICPFGSPAPLPDLADALSAGVDRHHGNFQRANGVDDDIASLDISETGQEILRYHQLTLTAGYDVATGLKVQCLTNVCVYFTGYDVVSVCVHHLLPAISPPP